MAATSTSVKELNDGSIMTMSTQATNLKRNASAPAHPSPLREASPVDEMKELSLHSHPDTPMDKLVKNGSLSIQPSVALTPPDSGARDQDHVPAKSTANMNNFTYTVGDDPFITPKGKDDKSKPSTVSQGLTQASSEGDNTFTPREDRIGKEVNADNAQGILTPKACVFVANLSNQRTDEQLEESVQQIFGAHGKCYVKIRRDKNQMPFAFVQYETVEAANEAISKCRGAIIDNRPTRCEHAKVNRALYLTRHTGGPISDAEARALLEPYGAIESTSPISIIDQHLFNLPEGIMVQFAYFQDARDAQMALKRHEVYRVAAPQAALDMRGPASILASPSPRRFRQDFSPYHRRWSNDDASIFIGNLPVDVSEEQLCDKFNGFGQIQSISIVQKPTPHGDGLNCFAFLSFQAPHQADAATQAKIMIKEHPLRIERKEYSNRRFRRNSYGARENQGQIFSALYQQGMQMGLSQDQAMRILSLENHTVPEQTAPQSWSSASPMSPGMYYAHNPYTLPTFQAPLNYNLNHMAYYNQYGAINELDDRAAMHTIVEADETTLGSRLMHQ
ncbi:putative rna recognition domain-containing protein [Phaeomoniella chlamydospora]|uniref:Putative rna recognition domain-containing protein n=1 Tax=Phaeomoniella chlamydospora TaxID=158046 RepID=A0A0G2ET95_PHACM|nr:putative rna recognition domain-containing protein [Phaeomoniella chlamydospora]